MISNFNGKNIEDNPNCIIEQLMNIFPAGKYYWRVDVIPTHAKPNICYVKNRSLKDLYHTATAKIWIYNSRCNRLLTKRKNQFYLQTWHGGLGFKKIEADVANALPQKYIEGAKNDAKMINLMTSGSAFFTNLCHTAFWYNGEVLECGTPRNDIFFNKQKCDQIYFEIREKYNLSPTDKILIYAPTFRKDQTLKYYDIDFQNTLTNLRKKFNGNWKIFVRLHPNISEKSKQLPYWSNDIINATDYPNSQELLIASDALISDYSSIAFDFALLRRPVFLYAPDYEQYKNDRDFYLDYFSLPFLAAITTEKLQENILNFSQKDYIISLEDFFKNKVGLKETGKASEEIADRIMKEIKNAD